jgi:predicted anti-sigma-YlaC factor YlaD
MSDTLPDRRPWHPVAAVALAVACGSPGCSVRKVAVNKIGDALAGGGATWAADSDPELIEAALPFSLKLMESLLAESPEHRGLRAAAAAGFTQYAYAFVQLPGDEAESRDLEVATRHRDRARGLYLRARDHGLAGLASGRGGLPLAALHEEPAAALSRTRTADVPLLYWTAVAWAAAIGLSKDDPDLVGDLPIVEALIARALALDEDFEAGAIHEFLIVYEMSRPGATNDAAARARSHFVRATELSGGQLASPFVALAESVSVAEQNAAEFAALLTRALAIDPDARPEWRLANRIQQRRARWLLDQAERLILD